MMDKKNILIIGNYGAGNFGDELVLESILKMLPKEKIRVVSRDFYPFPSGIRSFFISIFTRRIFKTLATYMRANTVIFGGGTLFTSEEPITIWIWSMQILPAIFLRKKIICFGQGIGPIRGRFSKWIMRKIFSRFAHIILRDCESGKILRSTGVTNEIKIVPDPVFAMKFEKAKGGELLVALRDWKFSGVDFMQKMTDFLEWIYLEYGLKTHFLIFDRADTDISEKIASGIVSYKAQISEVGFGNFKEIFSKGSFALNFRLHASILAFMHGIPPIGFEYETKVKSLFESVGMEGYAIGIDDFDILKVKFNSLYKNHDSVMAQLVKKCEEMRKTLNSKIFSIK